MASIPVQQQDRDKQTPCGMQQSLPQPASHIDRGAGPPPKQCKETATPTETGSGHPGSLKLRYANAQAKNGYT